MALISGAVLVTLYPSAFAEKLAGWDFNGLSGYGASPLAPTSSNGSVNIGGLTRGAGLTITGTAGASAWGGNGWDGATDAATAIGLDNFATFSVGPSGAVPIAITSIDAYNIRRSGSGPATGQWQYQIDSGSFVDFGSPITWGGTTSGAGNLQSSIDLSGITALQSVAAGTTVTFRIVNFGATSSGGTWYFNNFQSGDDLIVNGTINPGGPDTIDPAISSRSPNDDATNLTLFAVPNLILTFTEPVIAGTGEVVLKKADGTPVMSFTINDTNETAIDGAVVTFFLNEPSPLELGTSYYVELPATALRDAAGNFFDGLLTNTAWNFSIAPPPADPSVVINKFSASGSPDTVELLVVGSQVPGDPVNLQGMILKDFTTNMTADGGGKFQFANDLWSSVPVGTIIVLTKDGSTTDTDKEDGNFTLRVGLDDTAYFTNLGGTFDLSNIEMVMLKASGSGAAGTTGGIHALAGGAEGELYSLYPGAKLIATTGNNGVQVENTNGAMPIGGVVEPIDDFKSGTDATGDITFLPSAFGLANSGGNGAYISALRGLNPGDGDGTANIVNLTSGSPFEGKGFFDRGQTGQTARLTLEAFNPTVTIANVKIEVPLSVGTLVPANVSVTGPGTPVVDVTGQIITITGTAVTTENALQVTISGLSTPTPSLVTENGNYVFDVETSATGGTLANLATPPAVRVLIPIASLRDVDANGVPLDLGTIVAVDGVLTEENFGTSNTQAFLQQGGSGINLFYAAEALSPPLIRGNRYAAVGPVQQFSGLTEVVVASASDIVDLGVSTEPTPEIVTLATLFGNPEAYEGKLITVENLSYVSGTWPVPGFSQAANIVLEDSGGTDITVRIAVGSTAVPAPAFPATITGILSQSDGASPFITGYQLLPRDLDDLAAGSASDYDIWAGTPSGAAGGMAADPDFDGQPNSFEYAFGLNANSGSSVNPIIVPFNKTTGLFSYTRRKPSLTGLTYIYQYSTSLSGTWTAFTPDVNPPATNGGDPVETITVDVPNALLTEPKLFIRVTNP